MIYSATFLRAIIIMIVGVILSFSGIARGEKIRTAIPQANLNYLSIFVADAFSVGGDCDHFGSISRRLLRKSIPGL